jgi:PadR family transcriptional regulator, regulatory protein AphA
MNIKHAMLGFLSWRSFSGYELKKLFASSIAFYWSGNNNQIYKTLIEMNHEGFVDVEVQQQENHPAKKMYAITETGRMELRKWILSDPELPQLRNSFLIQLAWADSLDNAEIRGLLAKYEEEVGNQLLMFREQERRGLINPSRTAREAYLWKMISSNWERYYENEIKWVQSLRDGLAEMPGSQGKG